MTEQTIEPKIPRRNNFLVGPTSQEYNSSYSFLLLDNEFEDQMAVKAAEERSTFKPEGFKSTSKSGGSQFHITLCRLR